MVFSSLKFWFIFLCFIKSIQTLASSPNPTPFITVNSSKYEEDIGSFVVQIRNYRDTSEKFHKHFLEEEINKAGLVELKISGSGQFSTKNLEQILETLKPHANEILLVDLREEPHLHIKALINKIQQDRLPISWYIQHNRINFNKSLEEIHADEKTKCQNLLEYNTFSSDILLDKNDENLALWKFKILNFEIIEAKTEKQLIKSFQKKGHKVAYLRLPVSDFQHPKDSVVDDFINHYKTFPKDLWLHFHCAAGQGRTTTLMTMYDMMKNSHHASKKEIIKRQHLIGGSDLTHLTKNSGDILKTKWAKKRAKFINKFYDYCVSEAPLFKLSWSQWLEFAE